MGGENYKEGDMICTLIHHETRPTCCGCLVITYKQEGLFVACNECGKAVEFTDTLHALMAE